MLSDLADLQRNLVQVVRKVSIPRFHERVTARAGIDIDRVAAIALSRVTDCGEMRVTELANQLGVACSTAGRHAAHLAERGLVERSVDPEDARAVMVVATDTGRAMLDALRGAYRGILEEALDDWAGEDIGTLTDLVGRLADALEPAAPVESPSSRCRAEVVR